MDIDNMTPEQLREYAAQKEAKAEALKYRYINDCPVSAEQALEHEKASVAEAQAKVFALNTSHESYEKPIEVEGEIYWIDMRKCYSQRFILKMAAVQKTLKNDDEPDISDMLELFDFIMSNENEHIEQVVIAKTGFDDFREIYRIKEAIFDKVDLKN